MQMATKTMLEQAIEPHGECAVERWIGDSACATLDTVAEEVPVALTYNGIAHAVMLATPQDLEDFATGFSLSEGIIASHSDIFDIEILRHANGIELALKVDGSCDRALRARRRTLAGRTGCGLCGVESLEQAECHPLMVAPGARVSGGALNRARIGVSQMQKLFGLTGAVHAAAWCRADGEVICIREDVGRHNALDKLIGALMVAGENLTGGFVLMTSRASYEIVCKATRVGIGMVAALSAPTGMAVRIATAAGLTLVGFLREGSFSVYAHPGRVAT